MDGLIAELAEADPDAGKLELVVDGLQVPDKVTNRQGTWPLWGTETRREIKWEAFVAHLEALVRRTLEAGGGVLTVLLPEGRPR